MEIVIALLLVMIGDGKYEFVSEKRIPIEQCLAEAYEINTDPTTPYVLGCYPDIKVPRFES